MPSKPTIRSWPRFVPSDNRSIRLQICHGMKSMFGPSRKMIFVWIAGISQRLSGLKLIERLRQLTSVVQNLPHMEMSASNQRALQWAGDCLLV